MGQPWGSDTCTQNIPSGIGITVDGILMEYWSFRKNDMGNYFNYANIWY